MFTFLQHVDPSDENDAKPLPPKVCLMCQGQGVFYRQAQTTWTAAWRKQDCPACKGMGWVKK